MGIRLVDQSSGGAGRGLNTKEKPLREKKIEGVLGEHREQICSTIIRGQHEKLQKANKENWGSKWGKKLSLRKGHWSKFNHKKKGGKFTGPRGI